MAITQDSILAGLSSPLPIIKAAITPVANRPCTTWAANGYSGSGTYDTTLNGVVLDSTSAPVSGMLSFVPSVSPAISRLASGTFMTNVGGTLFLFDRLWHNGGISVTSTAAQAISMPTLPARDINGTSNGEGLIAMLELSASVGTGAPTITLDYTNSQGVSGRTATNLTATGNSYSANSTLFFGLQSGDTGIRSIQSITLSASWTTGTINLVLARVLTSTAYNTGYAGYFDPMTGGMTACYNGTVPYVLLIPTGSTSFTTTGTLQYASVAP